MVANEANVAATPEAVAAAKKAADDAAGQKEMEDMRAALRVLSKQAAEAKKEARKTKVTAALNIIKSSAGRRSVSDSFFVYIFCISNNSSGEEVYGDPLPPGRWRRGVAQVRRGGRDRWSRHRDGRQYRPGEQVRFTLTRLLSAHLSQGHREPGRHLEEDEGARHSRVRHACSCRSVTAVSRSCRM